MRQAVPQSPLDHASVSRPGATTSGAHAGPSWRPFVLPVGCGLALGGFGALLPDPGLFRAFMAAAAALVAWSAALYGLARRRGRVLAIRFAPRAQHWVQACAQTAVLLYWGWHVRFVYAFVPLVVAQLLFAYGVESLVSWSRRDTHTLGFGPFPVILSINLFLWFKPDWFVLQFAMIPLGYLAKEWIRWNRQGRSTHVFNPSSFPLAVLSVVLIVTRGSGITFGSEIAASQFYAPYMYLVIFLAAIPGQLLFGVARMTVSAVITLYALGMTYFALTGTYLFYDTHIPIAVFLGMHLLFTDPSTSPRSEWGRIGFGMSYAIGTATCYSLLAAFGVPTFYDKLLPVPLLNLLVRRLDGRAAGGRSALSAVSGRGRLAGNLAYTGVWAGVFIALSALHGIGDEPRGQALPFWYDACRAGSARACDYAARMTFNYCSDGSGWACNEWGIRQVAAGKPADEAFRRACRLGFPPACENAGRTGTDAAAFARGRPLPADLPIVLRGTKRPLAGYSRAQLYARACHQHWPGACDASPAQPAERQD